MAATAMPAAVMTKHAGDTAIPRTAPSAAITIPRRAMVLPPLAGASFVRGVGSAGLERADSIASPSAWYCPSPETTLSILMDWADTFL